MGKVLLFLLALSAVGFGVYWKCGCCHKKVIIAPSEDTYWGPGQAKADDKTIKPFSIKISDKIIEDLNKRLDQTRLSSPLEGINFQYGFNTDTLKKIVKYWRNDYKWKDREAYLNKYPQFKTQIQGLDIHYIHVKPKITTEIKKTIPLLLLHGWPGSVREFYEIIPLLTTPRKGVDFVFEVIAPSLPGFGFSSAASKPGYGPAQIAVTFAKLMARLNHDKYYIQGGDWGSQIASHIGLFYSERVLGLHLNMCSVMSMKGRLLTMVASIYPSLFMDEKHAKALYPVGEKFGDTLLETGYLHIQATKPDTVGVGLTDSPAGLAAYILEKFSTGTNRSYRTVKDGGLTEKFTYTDLLDNVMIYWVTNSITSSLRIYAENFANEHRALGLDNAMVQVPLWCSKFDNELGMQPDWILRLRYPQLKRSMVHDTVGHFAALENPNLLADDVWSSFVEAENDRIEVSQKNDKQKKDL